VPSRNISKQFGNAVRNLRSAAGLSQEKLAESAGIHPTYIGMIERGVRNPTLDVAARIAKALQMSLPRLIEEAQARNAGKTKRHS
jgi:XRE family transcriptional regulator, regulator of sulfur utilization